MAALIVLAEGQSHDRTQGEARRLQLPHGPYGGALSTLMRDLGHRIVAMPAAHL